MPRIGVRMIKTAIAVNLCFIIYIIRGEGIPFYSAIAAVLCLRADISNTVAAAKSRIIATYIGGVFGLLFSVFEHTIFSFDSQIFRFFVISCMIIAIIYFSLLIHQPSTSYLSCVVFLCITVSRMGDEHYVAFAINRMIDTLIGVGIAYLVNVFHLPYKKQMDAIVINMDSLLKQQTLKTYTMIQIEKLYQRYPNLIIYSELEMSHVFRQLEQFSISLPFILQQGSVLYDNKKQIFLHPFFIEDEAFININTQMKELNLNGFMYELNMNHIIVHHSDLQNTLEQDYYDTYSSYKHQYFYHHKEHKDDHHILQIRIYADSKQLDKLINLIQTDKEEVKLMRMHDNELRIVHKQADVKEQLHWLSKTYHLKNMRFYHIEESDEITYFKLLKKEIKGYS